MKLNSNYGQILQIYWPMTSLINLNAEMQVETKSGGLVRGAANER